MRLPLIAAPMFRVSNVELVQAACRAGIIGAFPTANCRSIAELDQWLCELKGSLGPRDAPFCANLIMRRESLAEELACLCGHGVELVITSVGSPAPAIDSLHRAGTLVFADVASLDHARKAISAGVDGLVLLSAGAGGQTGWANGLAFVRAVRQFYDGIVVLAGGISDSYALLAAKALGADFAYMGTRFIATQESAASGAYKQMLAKCDMDDIVRTSAFTGLDTNMLIPSIEAADISLGDLPSDIAVDQAKELYGAFGKVGARRWADIWSAGHTVSGVQDIPNVGDLVQQLVAEYEQAGMDFLKVVQNH